MALKLKRLGLLLEMVTNNGRIIHKLASDWCDLCNIHFYNSGGDMIFLLRIMKQTVEHNVMSRPKLIVAVDSG